MTQGDVLSNVVMRELRQVRHLFIHLNTLAGQAAYQVRLLTLTFLMKLLVLTEEDMTHSTSFCLLDRQGRNRKLNHAYYYFLNYCSIIR